MVKRNIKKRLARWFFRHMPRRVRHGLVRRHAVYDLDDLDGVTIEVARTVVDYLDAFHIVHDAYVDRGWITPQRDRLWATSHHLFPESTVFLAKRHGRPVGTFTLVEDSDLGLPIDQAFEAVNMPRRAGRRFGEMASLAIISEVRRSGLALVLLAAIARYGIHRLGLTDLLCSVSVNIVDHYRALVDASPVTAVECYRGFRPEARALDYDPVVGLHVSLDGLETFIMQRMAPPDPGKFNGFSLLFGPFPAAHERLPEERLTREQLVRHKLPRGVFQDLFIRHTDQLARLAPQQRAHLLGWRSIRTVPS